MRIDPISGYQVIVAEHRAGRPNDFSSRSSGEQQGQTSNAACPFCPENIHLTPPSLAEVVDASGDWQVRVVPNKYPIVSSSDELAGPSGFHEVVIESRRHVADFTELARDDLASVMKVYRDRLRYWESDGSIRHVSLYKNAGLAAGASLEHLHSQLVALPTIPPAIERELEGAGREYLQHGRCVFCRLMEKSLHSGERLVDQNDHFVAFCPTAPRQPFETWILPTQHASRFERLGDEPIDALASIVQSALERLALQLSSLSYNLILHTAPFEEKHSDDYHWHWELIPRSTHLAGLEWGAGYFVNPLAPERAAALLRESTS